MSPAARAAAPPGRPRCYDNSAVESFFGTFKIELSEDFESAADVKTQAFDGIEIF